MHIVKYQVSFNLNYFVYNLSLKIAFSTILGCKAKYVIEGNLGNDTFAKITLTRTGNITHKKGEQAKNQIRQPQRSKLAQKIIREKLTAHDVAVDSFK